MIVSVELEMLWKERDVACFAVLSTHFCRKNWRKVKKFIQCFLELCWKPEFLLIQTGGAKKYSDK
jgi:hypothetical protein